MLTLKKLKESTKEVLWISPLSPSEKPVLIFTVFLPVPLAQSLIGSLLCSSSLTKINLFSKSVPSQ